MNNLLLIGFKSSGKSLLAKALAPIFNLKMVDTDQLIGEDPRKLYLERGEAGFRALEQKAIFRLSHCRDAVIATGGGSILDSKNVELFQKIGWMVYLSVDKEELKRRIFSQDRLPPFLMPSFNTGRGESAKLFEELYVDRDPIYQRVAHQIIPFGSLSIERQLDHFLQSLNPYLEWRVGREKPE